MVVVVLKELFFLRLRGVVLLEEVCRGEGYSGGRFEVKAFAMSSVCLPACGEGCSFQLLHLPAASMLPAFICLVVTIMD